MLTNKWKTAAKLTEYKVSATILKKNITDLEDKLIEVSAQPHGEVLSNKVKRCSASEGDRCMCSGMVFYGEKYDRSSALTDKALSFSQMLSFPYMMKDMTHGGIMVQCSFQLIKSLNEHLGSKALHPK